MNRIKKYNCFAIPYLIFVIISLLILILTPKGNFEIWLNQHHTSFSDLYFMYATWLGEGIIFGLLVLALIIYNIGAGLVAGITGLMVALVTSVMKNFVFPHSPRPLSFFHDVSQIHLVSGVQPLYQFSFPSGHTMSAFALFFFITLVFKNKVLGTIAVLISISVAISRVYLFQHFLLDVFFGSILGVIIAAGCFHFFKFIRLNPFLNRSLFFK